MRRFFLMRGGRERAGGSNSESVRAELSIESVVLERTAREPHMRRVCFVRVTGTCVTYPACDKKDAAPICKNIANRVARTACTPYPVNNVRRYQSTNWLSSARGPGTLVRRAR